MSPENKQPHTIEFAGQEIEPFLESATDAPEETINAVNSLMQYINKERLNQRIAEYRALLKYARESDTDGDGEIPLTDLEAILIDMLKAEK